MSHLNLLFICLGNICRSPISKATLNYFLNKKKINHFKIDSCGLEQYHIGENAHPLSIKIANNRGIYFEHTAKKINIDLINKNDFLLIMDQKNLNFLSQLENYNQFKNKIYYFRNFDQNLKIEITPAFKIKNLS